MSKVKISVSITPRALAYLKEMSQLEDRSISWLVNDLVIDDLKRTSNITRKEVQNDKGQ